MNLTTPLVHQIIQDGAYIATVFLVYLTWRQITIMTHQATTSFEDHLTEQYRRVMESIPIEIWLGSELETLDSEQRARSRDAIFRYIDLSNEQTFLHDKKRISDKTWPEWSDGIKANLKLPAFREVWEEVKKKCPESFRELKTLLGELDLGEHTSGSSL
jgi:hypothetical protein